MELSCRPGTTHCVLRENFPESPYNKSFIDQSFSVKMAGYWPHSGFLQVYRLSTLHKHAKKNLANIQPSQPHDWSTTHIYMNRAPYNIFLLLISVKMDTSAIGYLLT